MKTKLWIEALQAQVSRISQKDYQATPDLFDDAPDHIVQLSRDLDALRQTFSERDQVQNRLIHEIHHRVKNNLQIINSLLTLQSRTISDPHSRKVLKQAQIRMGALALIHRLIYEQEDENGVGRISIDSLFAGLCRQLQTAFRGRDHIRFACTARGDSLSLDNAVPLTLFTVEAVTNAYGHAFPDEQSGNIKLEFAVDGETACLRVHDDGVGYDTDQEFQSMGRQLMTAFARQLGGTLTIKSATTAGTIVTLSYPVRL
jgi:two-component sensor histidine kinase